MTTKVKHYDSKNLREKIIKGISHGFAWGFVAFFVMIIIFIIVKSVPGIQHYGFNNILFSNKFNFADQTSKQVSVWIPLSITFLISFGAILIAVPLGIKTASIIKFRIKNPKLQKWLKVIVETTSGIPSVIFGLFASQSLGVIVKEIFGLNTSYTVLTGIFMLSFMIIPTITSLTLNAYDSVDIGLLSTSISLGMTYTKSMYKVVKKETRGAITIAVIIAFTRAIGETMAVSMILDSWDYSNQLDAGLIPVLKSSLAPLGAVISKGLFSENGSESSKSLLYFYGIVLFVVVMILNGIVMFLTSSKNMSKYPKLNAFNKKVRAWFGKVWSDISYAFSKLNKNKRNQINVETWQSDINNIVKTKTKNKPAMYFYSYWKIFWESVAFAIVFGFISWIILDILIKGFGVVNEHHSTIFQYYRDTTGQATINTLLIIITTTLICLPIALILAIFLNEYVKNKKLKSTVLFFIDSLGATPSIIFGMFGSIFFIQTIGLTMAGTVGQSLLAGCLTIGIVILPNLIRNIQQALQKIPMIVRENAYCLGCTKNETVFKVVLPAAVKGIVSSVILSIGRILSETAPLYLTAGLSSSSTIAIMNPGQTLTTRIYAQLYSSSGASSVSIMYDAALSTLLLVLCLTVIGHVLIPYYKTFKEEIKLYWNIMMQSKSNILIKEFKKKNKHKIHNHQIEVSQQDQQDYSLTPDKNKYLLFGLKKIKLKYI